MGLFRSILALAVGISQGLVSAAPDGSQSVLEQVGQYKNALLVSDGKPTLCSIAVVTETYGIVAANCLKFSSGSTVDMAPKYQVAISGEKNVAFGTFDISKVTVHPKYDAGTQANNLAIVYYDASSKAKFTNVISDWPAEWKSYYFVHQTQANGTQPAWNSPLVAVTDATADAGECAKLSELYTKYKDDLICSQVTAPTYAVKDCVVPFGSMYGLGSSNLALGALFSHSATSGGSGLCSKGKVYSYFTVLRNYLAWVTAEVKSTVPVIHGSDSKYTPQTNAAYAMGMSAPTNTTTSSSTTSSSTTSSLTASSSTTSSSATSSTSSSSSSSTSSSASPVSALTVTLPAATVTITAPIVTSVVTSTSVVTTVLTVTAAPSTIFVTLPPATQTVSATVTNTVLFSYPVPTSSAIPSEPSNNSSGSKMSGAAIAAIIIGLLLLLALLAFLYLRRRKQRQNGYSYSVQDYTGLSRVRKWFFTKGNGEKEGNIPPLISHESPSY
ncbi:hypothetical protein GGI20_002629 [Coemansia sp. BCRC 34301]|nr:hypothetical protein GGI20_002629 [Coemansia sp. BCRC 34301]